MCVCWVLPTNGGRSWTKGCLYTRHTQGILQTFDGRMPRLFGDGVVRSWLFCWRRLRVKSTERCKEKTRGTLVWHQVAHTHTSLYSAVQILVGMWLVFSFLLEKKRYLSNVDFEFFWSSTFKETRETKKRRKKSFFFLGSVYSNLVVFIYLFLDCCLVCFVMIFGGKSPFPSVHGGGGWCFGHRFGR